MKDEIIVSIIVPAYNCEKYICRCLDSIKTHSKCIEIIIIDDGSNDKTYDLCLQYTKEYENIKLLSQKNSGVSSARNAGVDYSHGKWIMFVDSDDFLVDDYLERILTELDRSIESDIIVFSSHSRLQLLDKYDCIKSCLGDNTVFQSKPLYLNTVFSKLYKKTLLAENDISFEKELFNGEDTLFNLNAYMRANRISSSDKSIYRFFKNMASSTNRFNDQAIQNELTYHILLKVYFNTYKLFNTEWDDIYNLTLINGLYSIVYQFALCNKKMDKELLQLLRREDYLDVLKNLKKYKNKLAGYRYISLLILQRLGASSSILFVKVLLVIKRIKFSKSYDNTVVEI